MSEVRPISVLVVEDEEIHRELVSNQLSGDNPPFEVVFAGSCSEALKQLAQRSFECMVLDHNLPDGTGDQLLLQARDQLLTTPVVAFSTSIDPDVMVAEFKGGCVEFLAKRDAFKGDALARSIVSVVETQRARAAVARSGSSVNLIQQAERLITSTGEKDQADSSIQQKLDLIYETAVQNIRDGVLVIERKGRVLYSNPAVKRLLNLAETDQLPGHPNTTIVDVLTTEAAASFSRQAILPAEFESMLRAANGEEVPVLLGLTAMGEQGVICALTDLREIKAKQRECETKNVRLVELYETANRFVDNVSHEFRTPLTVIKGYAEVIEKELAGPVTEEQRSFLWTILDRTRDLAQMVDDLLDTSKIHAGCLRVDRQPHRVCDIVAVHRPAIVQKSLTNKVHFRDEVSAELPLVYADGEKVGRVILNLLVNATKFSDEGGDIVLWARTEPDGDIRIGVTDHGPGIAPEHLTAIFERFKQVGDPIRSSTKGFGLGLNIARELVTMNLGTMRVESELGKGSTFSFTLPPNDPQIVARRLLERQTEANNQPFQAVMLRVVRADAANPNELRLFLASHTYPMDLVLDSTEPGAFILLGACPSADGWANRIRAAWQQSVDPSRSTRQTTIDVRSLGRWSCPAQNDQAIAALAGHAKVGDAR